MTRAIKLNRAPKLTGVRKALLSTKIRSVNKETTAVAPRTVEKTIKGAKNGGKRLVARKAASTKTVRKVVSKTKLRANITPGTVLILLAGRFRGRRVVFLKQLTSGMLLVTGPYKYNGVPLQRVNQAYVISTSTKLDISSVKLSEKLTDDLFARPEEKKTKKFLENNMEVEKKKEVSADRLSLQKEVDTALIALVKKTPMLASYLKSLFSLKNGDAPHNMKF